MDEARVTSGFGTGVDVEPNGRLTMTNASRVDADSATSTANTHKGGGVHLDDAELIMESSSDVYNNFSAFGGGGVKAVNGSSITMSDSADIEFNDADGSNGGGVFLESGSTMTMSGTNTTVIGNVASGGGGGVYLSGVGDASSLTLADGASVYNNVATTGGGLEAVGEGRVITVDDAVVRNNEAQFGGGVDVRYGAHLALLPGASIRYNTATNNLGGGIQALYASVDADGGSPYDPVEILGNFSEGNGGGIAANLSTVELDTVEITSNTAREDGGGIWAIGDPDEGPDATVNITETGDCEKAVLAVDTFCNEFRSNQAGYGAAGTGGALWLSSVDLDAVKVGFVQNSADDSAILKGFGDSAARIGSSMASSNTMGSSADEGLISMHDTSSVELRAVTFADHADPFLDVDDSATALTARVITTTGTQFLDTPATGGCNIGPVSAALPGKIAADALLTTRGQSSYVPASGSPAIDACARRGALSVDARDTPVIDGDGTASTTEYDVGGLEAPAGK